MSYTGIRAQSITDSRYGMFTAKGGRLLSNRLVRFNDRLYELEQKMERGELKPYDARKKAISRVESLVGSYARLKNNPPEYAGELIDTDVRDQFYGEIKDILKSSDLFEHNQAMDVVEDAKEKHGLF